MVMKAIMMMRVNSIVNKQQQLPKGFANSCCKKVSLILPQKLINDFPVFNHRSKTLLLVEDISQGFGN